MAGSGARRLQLYAAALRAQLGHRRFHRSGRLAANCGGAQGADVVGAQSAARAVPAQPGARQPLQPVEPAQLNPLYLDVEAIADFRDCAAARGLVQRAPFQARLSRLRARRAGRLRTASPPPSTRCWSCSTRTSRAPPIWRGTRRRAQAFRAFCGARGESLQPACAVRGAAGALPRPRTRRSGAGRSGPRPIAIPDAPAVAALRRASTPSASATTPTCSGRPTVQLDAAAARSPALGMGVGLYHDLAVSVDRGGAETWAAHGPVRARRCASARRPTSSTSRARTGACRRCVPHRLREAGLRAVHRDPARQHAPRRRAAHRPRDGADAPVLDRRRRGCRATAPTCTTRSTTCWRSWRLESQRNRCMVIGEDLGTVPRRDARRHARRAACCRTACCSSSATADGDFQPPAHYPRAGAGGGQHARPADARAAGGRATTSRCARALGLFPDARGVAAAGGRARAATARACCSRWQREGCCRQRGGGRAPASLPTLTPRWRRGACLPGAHAVAADDGAARGRARRDRAGQPARHHRRSIPNWRRKLPLGLEAAGRRPALRRAGAALRRAWRAGAAARSGAARCRRTAIPRATYRLQLHSGFTLRRCHARIVPYLRAAGHQPRLLLAVSCARAPGSTHGYDIVDHDELNPEIGTRGRPRAPASTRCDATAWAS